MFAADHAQAMEAAMRSRVVDDDALAWYVLGGTAQ